MSNENVVAGVVIDSNNPVFRTSSGDQFTNAENPVEAHDVLMVGEDPYYVRDVRVYRDAVTLQKKGNIIIMLSMMDLLINMIKYIESHGNTFYIFFMLCSYYGYVGAKEFNYQYISIYTIYLSVLVFSNMINCFHGFYVIDKYDYQYRMGNITHTTQEYSQVKTTNTLNVFSLIAQLYVYFYAHLFKEALKGYNNVATVVGVTGDTGVTGVMGVTGDTGVTGVTDAEAVRVTTVVEQN